MPIYEELLGDVTDQERMARAAQKLRRREAFSTLGAFSGDPYMAPWGRQQLQQLPTQGQGLARARQAAERLNLDRRRLRGTTLTPAPGMTYQPYAPEGQQWSEAPGWRERQQGQFERQMELKRAGGRAAAERFMREQAWKESRMSDSMEKDWRQTQATIFKGRAMLEQAKELAANKGAFVEPVADLPSRALGAMGLESLSEMAASAHKTPEEMATRANMADWIADMRKERMGAAVTAYEGAKATPWDPTAGGITQDVALKRWEDLVQAMEYASAVMAYGKRIPGVKDDPTALPPRPVGMTDEEFLKFNEKLQQMMRYGGGFTSGKPATSPAAPAAPAAPKASDEGFRFE